MGHSVSRSSGGGGGAKVHHQRKQQAPTQDATQGSGSSGVSSDFSNLIQQFLESQGKGKGKGHSDNSLGYG